MWFDESNFNVVSSSNDDDVIGVQSDSGADEPGKELTMDDVLFNYDPAKRRTHQVVEPEPSNSPSPPPLHADAVVDPSGCPVKGDCVFAGGSATALPQLRSTPVARPLAELRAMTCMEVRGHLEYLFAMKEEADKRFREAEAAIFPDTKAAEAGAPTVTLRAGNAEEMDRCARIVNVSNWANGREGRDMDVLLPAALVPRSNMYAGVVPAAAQQRLTLRDHQINGIRFLWSVLAEGPVGQVPAVGCILAHTMGLGKTAQVVLFIHLFRCAFAAPQRVLIVVPKSTQASWVREFTTWSCVFPEAQRVVPVVMEEGSRAAQRIATFRAWRRQGGVLLIGYEAMVRLMQLVEVDGALDAEVAPNSSSVDRNAASSRRLPAYATRRDEGGITYSGERDPFTELLVCDEAHRLKSANLQVVGALRGLHPLRRLLLTGTPLQNHLREYWAMVDFAMHKYFEPRRFRDFFINPIEASANCAASQSEVDVARKKTFTLINEVRHFVQRVDSTPLKAELPPLHEYIVVVPLSALQKSIYLRFLRLVQYDSETLPFLPAVSYAGKIASHPQLLFQMKELGQQRRKPRTQKATGRSNASSPTSSRHVDKNYLDVDEDDDDDRASRVSFSSLTHDEEFIDLCEPPDPAYVPKPEDGTKLLVAMNLVMESMRRGEKTLLFSLSTRLLDFFELLISKVNVEVQKKRLQGESADIPRPLRFCRLDGTHSVAHRASVLREFDSAGGPDLFLLSMKAGGVGITITAATRVILVDTSFNPADDQQAIGRAYRYGQTRPVFVYRLLCHHALEYSIFEQKLAKEWLFKTVVEETAMKRDGLSGMHLRRLFSLLGKAERALQRPPVVTRAQVDSTASVFAEDEVLSAASRGGELLVYAQPYSTFLEHDQDDQFGEDEEQYYKAYRRDRLFAVHGTYDAAGATDLIQQQRQNDAQAQHIRSQARSLTSMVDDLIRSRISTDPQLVQLLGVMGLKMENVGGVSRVVMATGTPEGEEDEASTSDRGAPTRKRRRAVDRNSSATSSSTTSQASRASSPTSDLDVIFISSGSPGTNGLDSQGAAGRDVIRRYQDSRPTMLIDSDSEDAAVEVTRTPTAELRRHDVIPQAETRPVVPFVVSPTMYEAFRPGSSTANPIDVDQH